METKESALAAAIKVGRYPSYSTLAALEDSGAALAEQHQLLGAAIDQNPHFRDRLKSALQGQAGDAAMLAHDGNRKLWQAHEDLYGSASVAVTNAVSELRRLQSMLQDLIDATEPQYNAALQRGDHIAAQSILTAAAGEADGMVAEHAGNAESYIKAVDFTAPLNPAPADGPGPPPKPQRGEKHHKKWSAPADNGGEGDSGDAESYAGQADKWEAPPGSGMPASTDLTPPLQPGKWEANQGQLPQIPMPASQMGSGAGSGLGSGGGGLSGLSSGLRSPMGGMSGMATPASPASAMPQAPSSAGSASPLANAGSSFQSGLASGMGGTGGMTTPVAPPAQQPTAPIAATQPPVAGPTSAGAGMSSAGVPPGRVGLGQEIRRRRRAVMLRAARAG
ncbi:hypothetical protein ACK280_27190 [Mycobacterium sherrisii]|uniref:hypothetical protein n=1 Tax=Mycobacterium sherrisii TaxID=243061 RepID=UPI0039766CDF